MNAVVIGAGGAIGGALADALEERGDAVVRLSRGGEPAIDLERPDTIAAAAAALGNRAPFDTLLVATGLLHDGALQPEKTLRSVEPKALGRLFAVNAIGPALVIRDFLPLMARDRRAVIGVLSARVGSIGDNRLGGWVGYRSSKAALNQIVRTFAIELARTHPLLVLAGLHPGTVDSRLSAPFQRSARQLLTAAESARHLLGVLERLGPADSGGLFDWRGERLPA